jgi:hypothetical protein
MDLLFYFFFISCIAIMVLSNFVKVINFTDVYII